MFLLVLVAMEARAAIRASEPDEPTTEIRLELIPNRKTAFFAHRVRRPWESWGDRAGGGESPLMGQVLDHLRRTVSSPWRAIIELAISSEVEEVVLARWPDQAGMGETRRVWMVGARARGPEQAALLARGFVEQYGLLGERPQERRVLGHRVTSHRVTGGWIHGLFSDRSWVLASNLGLLQAYLSTLPSATAPPLPPEAGILIGWKPGSLADSPVLETLGKVGLGQCLVGFKEHDRGVEIRLSLEARVPFQDRLTQPLDPGLLESVPPDADLLLAGGSTEWIRPGGEGITQDLRGAPFSIGVGSPSEGGLPPEGWAFAGAVRRTTASVEIPIEVERFLRKVSGTDRAATAEQSVRFDPFELGWKSESLEDRVLFGSAPRKGRGSGEPIDVFKPFSEFAREASLGGILSPRMMALPLAWDTLIHHSTLTETVVPFDLSDLSPLEFALVPRERGFEVRFLSASPASHLLFWTSLALLLDIDQAGKWDTLAGMLQEKNRP
ncbi:MAG: hypothetical protein HUU16_03520 [Candidatus Omnitrophica bacterium]|nr:hypothetical protein [Candidatus Omnitrophota bacterium]